MKSSEILNLISDHNSSVLVVGDISNWDAICSHLLDAHEKIHDSVARINVQFTSEETVLRNPGTGEETRIETQDLAELKRRIVRTVTELSGLNSEANTDVPQRSHHVAVSDFDSLHERYDSEFVDVFLQALGSALGEYGFLFLHLPIQSGNAPDRYTSFSGVNTKVEFQEREAILEYRWYTENADKPTDWHRVEDAT